MIKRKFEKLTKLQANEATHGFTLIEIMVAVSIFTIVAVITTGALVTASEVNRKAQAIKIAMDNVAFAMDSMVANLREGVNYHCLASPSADLNAYFNPSNQSYGKPYRCTADGRGVLFGDRRVGRGGDDKRIIYRFEDNNGWGKIQFASTDAAQYVDLTSGEVDIDYLRFYVPDTAGSPPAPVPRITIVIEGTVPGKTLTKFNLQTTVKANF